MNGKSAPADAAAAALSALCGQFGWRTDGDAAVLADRIAHHIRDLKACVSAHVADKTRGGTATADVLDAAQSDATRIDFIEKMLEDNGTVWFLPSGPELRFLQIRTPGQCFNGPTVPGLRGAIDAMQAARKNTGEINS
jgi:hypothetical protein